MNKPIVQNNGYDSALYIEENGAVHVKIQQLDKIPYKGIVVEAVRYATIRRENIEDILPYNICPGTIMQGDIIEHISYSPPDPDDPMVCLSWIDGQVEKIDGKPVWRWESYEED